MPNVFILTWNPKLFAVTDEELRREARRTAAGKRVRGDWAVGARRGGIEPGDYALKLRQSTERGIISSGRFTSEVYQAPHWDGSGREANYARLYEDTVVETKDRLPVEVLHREVPEVHWDRLQGSGVRVPDEAAERLLELWFDHTGRTPYHSPEEVAAGSTYGEGAVTQVLVNRYERDRRAREECIAHHGTACTVCGFDFGSAYGPLGDGFIHVHHLSELSSVGSTIEVSPIEDLRPVCPNCHAMLHRRRPALSIEELKRVIERGSTGT